MIGFDFRFKSPEPIEKTYLRSRWSDIFIKKCTTTITRTGGAVSSLLCSFFKIQEIRLS